MTLRADWEVVAPAAAELGERPVWDDMAERLVWVDILAGQVRSFRPGGGDTVLAQLGASVGAVGLRRGGGYVAAAADGFHLLEADGSQAAAVRRAPWDPDAIRANDGAVDPAGRFWAGTVALDERPGAGTLYRLEPDGKIVTVLDSVTESNGLAWSPDGRILYYVDSGEVPSRIRSFEFDVDRGEVGRERELVAFGPDEGVPDGLVVDEAGCVWVAMWGGGEVRRFTASGEHIATLLVPVSQPTCPGFGGADLADLYVTTAWLGSVLATREPEAGHLFRTRPGVRGLPAHRYAR